jgi:hypothetical protein
VTITLGLVIALCIHALRGKPLQGPWHQDQEGEMIFCAAPA